MINRAALPAVMALFWSVAAGAATPSSDASAADSERFGDMIESLNSGSSRRAAVVEAAYKELRGPNAKHMRDALQGALFRPNVFIRQGAAEALAMLGDINDMPVLEAILSTSRSMEVRCLILRLLPAFCLGHAERPRLNYIRYASGAERIPGPNVLAPLRRPPLNRRGRLDPGLESARTQVIQAIIRQFDPVGAALRHIDNRLYSKIAAEAVAHYVGGALGNDPSRWARLWAARGESTEILVPDEVTEIRMAAIQSLSDMAAEALPEVMAAFQRLMEHDNPTVVQALFDAMSVMCASAYDAYPVLADMDTEGWEAAENWRRRCFGSAAALASFAAARATAEMKDVPDDAFFASAAFCLGTALSFPIGFPDPDGSLASARERGLDRLEFQLLSPELTPDNRVSVVRSLGLAGGARAVSALGSILSSPYALASAGADGMRLAGAAVDSLSAAAAASKRDHEAARAALLNLLLDKRSYPAARGGGLPVGLAHLALWRLQRLAKSTDVSLDPEVWRTSLGW